MKEIKRNSWRAWLLAARPKTLAGAATPVLIGAALAYADGQFQWLPALVCFLFAGLMQIAANFINDLFDCLKGTDREDRLGPERACAQGWISRCHEIRNYIHHYPGMPYREHFIVLRRLAANSRRIIVCHLRILLHHRALPSLVQWVGGCTGDYLFWICTCRRHLLCTNAELDTGCHSSFTGLRTNSRHIISYQ